MSKADDILGYVHFTIKINDSGNTWPIYIPVYSMDEADRVALEKSKTQSSATDHCDIRLVSPSRRKVLKTYYGEERRDHSRQQENSLENHETFKNYSPEPLKQTVGHNTSSPSFSKTQNSTSMKSTDVDGKKFYLDTEKATLVDSTDFNNRLPVIEMEGDDKNYWFTIDRSTKRFVSHGMELQDDKYIRVLIPHMVSIDPEGVRKKFGIAVDKPLPNSDFDLKSDARLLKIRELGTLPIVKVGPWEYLVDGHKEHIRPVKADRNWMPVRYDQLAHVNDEFRFLFNLKSGRIILGESKGVYAGNDLVIASIPGPIHLDPVGFARKEGERDDFFVAHFPVRPTIEAKISKFPINKSLNQVLRDVHLFRPKESPKKGNKVGL
jgi:hypothetical protein